MKTIEIYCKKCKCKLTDKLIEVPYSQLHWDEGTGIMELDQFAFFKNKIIRNENIVVAVAEYYLENHSDYKRFSGCCGSSSFNSLNKTCKNGHEVATEISDCWTAHYLEFDRQKIIIKETKNKNTNEDDHTN